MTEGNRSNSSHAVKFEGEEAGAGYASVKLDLIASAILVALSIVVLIASWFLPIPGGTSTAPGLLPFLIALALLFMGVLLAVAAWRRRVVTNQHVAPPQESAEWAGTLGLAVAVALYIGVLHALAFQHHTAIFGLQYTLSAFEPATVVLLSVIIGIAWRGPLWITLGVSFVWTLILSLVFQKVFQIPLPGGF